ncbi:MAG: hypothetical protein KY453_04215, partial [Gemmatimonadetes bacterium]|nr:hypothetical protein [Gemmatimonadota bacterium]
MAAAGETPPASASRTLPALELPSASTLDVAWSPDPPTRGRLFVVRVVADPAAPLRVEGRFAGEPLHFRLGERARSWAVAAVPVDAPGLTIVSRPAGRPGENAAKFSARYGQCTAVCVFEDVFVPNERVFLAGEHRHSRPPKGEEIAALRALRLGPRHGQERQARLPDQQCIAAHALRIEPFGLAQEMPSSLSHDCGIAQPVLVRNRPAAIVGGWSGRRPVDRKAARPQAGAPQS